MKPESSPNPRQKLEARVTALLLGEITGTEADNLRQTIANDAELTKLYEQLKNTIKLVRETSASPAEPLAEPAVQPKLGEERRQKLLAHFKTVKPKEFQQPRRRLKWLVPAAATACILLLLASVVTPHFSRSSTRNMASYEKSRSTSESIWDRLSEMTSPARPAEQAAPANAPEPPREEVARRGKGEMVLHRNGQPAPAQVTPPPASPAQQPIVLPQESTTSDLVMQTPGVSAAGGDSLKNVAPINDGNFYFSTPALANNNTLSASSGGANNYLISDGADAQVPRPTLSAASSETSLFNQSINRGSEVALVTKNKIPDGNEDIPVSGSAEFTDVTGSIGDQAYSAYNPNGSAAPSIYLPTGASKVNNSGTYNLTLADGSVQSLDKRSFTKAVNFDSDSFATNSIDMGALTILSASSFETAPADSAVHAPEPQNLGVELNVPSTGIAGFAGSSKPLNAGESAQAVNEAVREQSGRVTSRQAVEDGRLLLEQGKLDEADTKFKAALKDDPGNQVALYYSSLADDKRKDGDFTITKQSFTAGDGSKPPVAIASSVDAMEPPGARPTIGAARPGTAPLRSPKATTPVTTTAAAASPQTAALEGEKLDRLKMELAESKTRQPLEKPVAPARSYEEAKLQLNDLRQTEAALRKKIAAEQTDLSVPKTSMLEVVDRAKADPEEKSRTIRERLTGNVERFARLEVKRDVSDINPTTGSQHITSYDPYFIQTEFEVLQSDMILGKAIEKLSLNEAWAEKYGRSGKLQTPETVALLKKQLDLRPVPNTTQIDIGVKSDNAEDAARIANAIADAYQEHRLAQNREWSLASIQSLETKRQEVETQVTIAQAEVDRLAKETGATEPDQPLPKPAVPLPVPQPEIQTRNNAFSTFSLNVSDVSFKLAAASLQNGVLPEPGSIRSEEFINAFDYRDPEPAAGAPIAFAWERARYPFTHNRDLLRLSLKTAAAGRQAGRPLNLVLLLDNSGSMERADRVNIIREALRILAAQLQPQDRLSVITFARTAQLRVDGVSGIEATNVIHEVAGLTPQGGTNLEDAMNLAYATALKHYLTAGINRVVLLTDGAANLGNVDPESLKQKVEAHRKQGVAFDCFGIGWEGYNDDLLEVLSRNGDGRYGFINTPDEAASGFAGQLAGALQVAASDVKVQVEFNPNRVTAYRQIGYAKHQLTKEQFRDNTVDAAEIGAAESGNALYVIEVNAAGEGPLGVVRVRYKVPGTTNYREQEWTVPFAGNAVALEQSSPAMKLAASSSAFSEWLATSPYAGEVTPDALLGYMRGVPEVYGADPRPKNLEWMIRQARSLAGK